MRRLFRQERSRREAGLGVHFQQYEPARFAICVVVAKIRTSCATATKSSVRCQRYVQRLRIALRVHSSGDHVSRAAEFILGVVIIEAAGHDNVGNGERPSAVCTVEVPISAKSPHVKRPKAPQSNHRKRSLDHPGGATLTPGLAAE